MGLLLCPPLPYHNNKDFSNHSQSDQSHSSSSNTILHSESSNSSSSLPSQLSLPSVPSLTTTDSNKNIHYHCLQTLKANSGYFSSLVLSAQFLFSGSSNSEIRAWNINNMKDGNSSDLVGVSNGAVKSLVIFGDKIFSAHQDNKIRVWKVQESYENRENRGRNRAKSRTYTCIATLPTMKDRFSRYFSSKNYVQVRRHKKSTWVHHVDAVSSLAISKDGSLLFSASWDRAFKVWRTMDFKCLESIKNAHDDAINAIVVSGDGFVYTGSADKKIKVWKRDDSNKHSLVSTMEKHKSSVNALSLIANGSVLYSAACDRSILVWEKTNNNDNYMVVTGALRGHTKAVLCLGVVGDFVFSGSADKTIRVWRRENCSVGSCYYSSFAVLSGNKKPVKCLTATNVCNNSICVENGCDSCTNTSGSGLLVYSGSLDCDIRIWHISVPN